MARGFQPPSFEAFASRLAVRCARCILTVEPLTNGEPSVHDTIGATMDRGLEAIVDSRMPLRYAEGADDALDRPAVVRSASSLAWVPGGIALVQDDANFIGVFDPSGARTRAIALPAACWRTSTPSSPRPAGSVAHSPPPAPPRHRPSPTEPPAPRWQPLTRWMLKGIAATADGDGGRIVRPGCNAATLSSVEQRQLS